LSLTAKGNTKVGINPVYLHYKDTDVGIVSWKSQNYLLKHLQTLHDGSTEKTQCLLNPDDKEFLLTLRNFHPLRAIRSLCNVLLGLIRVLPHLKTFDIFEIEASKLEESTRHHINSSRHQEEIVTALKLHILAIHYGNPVLGLLYCSIMSQNHPEKAAYMRRVRKRYKSLSGHSVYIANHIAAGNLNSSHLSIIADEIFSRRPNQLGQSKKYSKDAINKNQDHSFKLDLNLDFDQLFNDFERHALQKDDETMVWPQDTERVMDTMESEIKEFNSTLQNTMEEMKFNIDIGQKVDAWALANGMVLDSITGRYIGYEDEGIEENEEGW